MSNLQDGAQLHHAVIKLQQLFRSFPQGADLDFEKVMNPCFEGDVASLRQKIRQLVMKLLPPSSNQGKMFGEQSIQQISYCADSLIQQAVCHHLSCFSLI
jgi:hypothetical protein